MNLPTGTYSGKPESTWLKILEAAKAIPRLRRLAENYETTGHPACLNAIMHNAIGADASHLWFIWYGK